MSISVLVLMFFVLAAVAFGIIWRNVQDQKRPKKRFKVGRNTRNKIHPVRGKRMTYTEIARAQREAEQARPSSGRGPADKSEAEEA